MDSLGATTITFNPVPPTVLAKAIQTIAAKEELVIEAYVAAGLAAAAGGDLRNAIQGLQMHFGKSASGGGAAAAAGAGKVTGRGGKVRKGLLCTADGKASAWHLFWLGTEGLGVLAINLV